MNSSRLAVALLAAGLITTNCAVYAGPSSALDPYAYLQPQAKTPKPNKKARLPKLSVAKQPDLDSPPQPKPVKPPKLPKIKPIKVAQITEPKVAEVKPEEPKKEKTKTEKHKVEKPKEEKIASQTKTKAAPQPQDDNSGFVSNIKDSSADLARSAASIGNDVKEKTRKMSTSLANSAKSSAGFMKNGAKKFGSKIKETTLVAGNKISDMPKIMHRNEQTKPGEQTQPGDEKPAAATEEQPQVASTSQEKSPEQLPEQLAPEQLAPKQLAEDKQESATRKKHKLATKERPDKKKTKKEKKSADLVAEKSAETSEPQKENPVEQNSIISDTSTPDLRPAAKEETPAKTAEAGGKPGKFSRLIGGRSGLRLNPFHKDTERSVKTAQSNSDGTGVMQ